MTERYTEVRHLFGSADVPEQIPSGVMLVLVNEQGVPQAVNFLCPCGCGNECYTPLTTPERPRKDNRPIWDYESGPTIKPSIRYTGGCKSHFTITDGEVSMHSDSGK